MQDDSIDEGVLTDTKILGEMHGAWNQSIRYSFILSTSLPLSDILIQETRIIPVKHERLIVYS